MGLAICELLSTQFLGASMREPNLIQHLDPEHNKKELNTL
jgi:hypothetical protein